MAKKKLNVYNIFWDLVGNTFFIVGIFIILGYLFPDIFTFVRIKSIWNLIFGPIVMISGIFIKIMARVKLRK